MATDKELFDQTFDLCMQIPWLLERDRELNHLLQECNADQQLTLLSELLSRFVYLKPEDIENCLESFVTQIVNVWNLSPGDTQLVAMTFDDQADSGQWVLHYLKAPLAKQNWRPARLTNTVPRAVKYFQVKPNIVLVDEFSGTGQTVINRINFLRREATRLGIPNYQLRVCLIAAMEKAYDNIVREGVDCFVIHKLKQGISERYLADELTNARAVMQALESMLAPTYGGKPLPTFGHGGAEALYSADGNIPNSVFPVFWWPEQVSGKLRTTLFHRLEP